MNLKIKVTPGAKRNLFKQEGALTKVYLTAPALEGRANKALIGFLAKHFKVKKSQVKIIKGLKLRNKTISIEGI